MISAAKAVVHCGACGAPIDGPGAMGKIVCDSGALLYHFARLDNLLPPEYTVCGVPLATLDTSVGTWGAELITDDFRHQFLRGKEPCPECFEDVGPVLSQPTAGAAQPPIG